MTEYKLFAGCTIGNRIPFIESSARLVFNRLGIQISEAQFSCCPDVTGFKTFDNFGWLVLGARNLCLAEAEGKDIITLCNGCANTLRGVSYQLKHDSHKKEKVNEELAKIGKEYQGTIEIKHFVDVLKEDIGISKIQEKIEKPLTPLKVACHPGCHYMRPTEWMENDDPMNPRNLKELVASTGANVIDYEGQTVCCGSATMNHYGFKEIGMQMLKHKFDLINKTKDVDVICVHCPSCFRQFDTKQKDLQKEFGIEYNIPVLYLTELLALSMGFDLKDYGMKFHRIRLNDLIDKALNY